MATKLIITCEHGGNQVPAEFQQAFIQTVPEHGLDVQEILQSHRGWDPGALELAKFLAKAWNADELFTNTMTRLLIDYNRSPGAATALSEWSRRLPSDLQGKLFDEYWRYVKPLKQAVLLWIMEGFTVLHISVHSFTPELNGEVRTADIGWLYDPARPLETLFAQLSGHWLSTHTPLRVQYNYPYLGTDDGLTTILRNEFRTGYIGLELETNQALWQQDAETIAKLHQQIADSISGRL